VVEKKRKKKKKHKTRSPHSSGNISNEESDVASPKAPLSDDQAMSESELESKRLELLKQLAED
jgi:hypothetical protein